jgi:coproporphyrinogen III oxidase
MTNTLNKKDQIEQYKKISAEWFQSLRDQICNKFEELDGEGKFERKAWERPGGGSGVMSTMKGKVFEKVGVNISTVFGEFSEEFRKEIPGAVEDPKFWASGISLVAHMSSPHVPAVHMNTRMIVTSKSWFGGGADLNPMFENDDDTKAFHKAFADTCNKYDPEYYAKFKKWADEYFFIKHRGHPRGVGGIFFDYLNTGDIEKDFSFVKDVGSTFLDIYSKIVSQHKGKKWTPEERAFQLEKRGRYTEFNLLYDRGTRFGLMTGGNPEAILMSLPPIATWS